MVPAEDKIDRAVTIHEILLQCVFQNKTSKNEFHYVKADPGAQTATVPVEAKIDRAITIHENFYHVLAAQTPTTYILTSVACGPHSPRPKDCPGLGSPNTLKLAY